MNEIQHCVYHAGCPDGFTSAWIVKHAFPDVILHKGVYGQPPPDFFSDSVVYIVDFSYSADEIRELAKKVKRVIILDHHKTAKAALNCGDLGSNVEVVFDMGRSGAMITFEEFKCQPSFARTLVQYVQDRDLWTWKLDQSEAIGAVILATNLEHNEWTKLAHQLDSSFDFSLVVTQGLAILKRDAKVVEEILLCARRINIGGYDVLAVPSPYVYGSTVAGELAKRTGVLFGAYYVDRPEHRQFGLRSEEGSGCDVAVIAELYGGGGHANAAGFNVPWDHELANPCLVKEDAGINVTV